MVTLVLNFNKAENMDWKKNLELNDIVPVGDFEALPVTMTYTSYQDYPDVVVLASYKFDTKPLIDEFFQVESQMLEHFFIPERKDHLINVSEGEIRQHLSDLGFTKSNYRVHSLRQLGTQENNQFVRTQTGLCLNKFSTIFRQQYMVAEVGLIIAPHIDNKNIALHGFRIHIPLHPFYIGFETDGGIFNLYRLNPGVPVFVNFCRSHFVVNPLGHKRVNIAFQLSDDALLLPNIKEKTQVHDSGPFQELIDKVMGARQDTD